MWMQKSVGSGASSLSSSGNFHDRNRFGSPYGQGGSYGGSAPDAAHDAGDWKSKILESGQWLGGKVIEYGGKLARGPNSDAIPEHYAQQMPRNDGRANWMADIRSSSSSISGTGGYNAGYNGSGGGYQNDFATERPKAYSDYSSNPSGGGYEPKSLSAKSDSHKTRHAKKKSDMKKRKSSKKSKKKQQSESESESDASQQSESEELSVSESSETESADERRHKSKAKAKGKKKSKSKKSEGFYSEESESDGEDRKKAANYAFSFDPAKLPPPPVEEEKTSKKTKAKKSKKEKSSKKSRARRQSVASTDDESVSEQENSRKAKKRGSKKAAAAATAAASSASVDLLGVDLDVQPAAPLPSAAQEVQSSIFDAPSQNPLQELAGLSFAPAPVLAPAPVQQSVFGDSSQAPALNVAAQSQQQADAFRTNLLPENNIVDFDSLASEKKKALSANPEEKRTLNDMQKARGADQPTPVMAMPMQGQQQMQPNMPGGMMLNMNQLQITDGATGMQQQMYPNMPMQQMPMQGMSQQQMQPQMMMMQPQMGMMAQPQMMNMQMMQQQFAQGSAAMGQPAGAQQTSQGMMGAASSSNSSDPFRQLP